MRFNFVHHYEVDNSARTVVFVGRSIDGEQKHHFAISDYMPYFGVPWSERNYDKDNRAVVRIGESKDIYQNRIGVIYVRRSIDVKNLRTNYSRTYESKLNFHDRVRIDKGIKAGFTVPEDKIDGYCFSCGGSKYHKISHSDIRGW